MKQLFRSRWWKRYSKDFAIASSFAVSISALAVSALTFFFSMRTVDDLRVTIGTFAGLSGPSGETKLSVSTPRELTLINSGNRAVAVLNVRWAIFQSEVLEPVASDCPVGKSQSIQFETKPFVVKAGEIIVQPVPVDPTVERNDHGQPVITLEPKLQRVVSCIVFDLVTPDNVSAMVRVPLHSSEFQSGGYGTSDIFFSFEKPIRIFPRVSKGSSTDG